MSEHRWGEPDKDGVRACLRGGCTVRLGSHGLFWQMRPRAHWRSKRREPLSVCTGTDAPEAIGIPVVREPDDMPGGHWREACCFCVTRTPYWTAIPERTPGEQVACCQSCAATHKPEEVPTKAEWFKYNRKVRNSDAPEATPSPLEVVRKALETFQNMGGTVWANERKMASDGLAALATLEESIRADEREACAKELDDVHLTVAARVLRKGGTR